MKEKKLRPEGQSRFRGQRGPESWAEDVCFSAARSTGPRPTRPGPAPHEQVRLRLGLEGRDNVGGPLETILCGC